MSQGVIVGCDAKQQWLLPWWWRHYSAHNTLPVAFFDFGMTEEAVEWCKEKGCYFKLKESAFDFSENRLSSDTRQSWEKNYGSGFWLIRSSWMYKPLACLSSPFEKTLWLDVDCEVRQTIDPLFSLLALGADIAIAKELDQQFDYVLPGEIVYNSGVIVFRAKADILTQWAKAAEMFKDHLPGDQEMLSRAIFLHEPALVELPVLFNWCRTYGDNKEAAIFHHCNGVGKIQILQSLSFADAREKQMLFQACIQTVYGDHFKMEKKKDHILLQKQAYPQGSEL